jgi:hypothetical protein
MTKIMTKAKLVICLAGAIGSSKTTISNYLSTKLNLPVFNNDALRAEVTTDLGRFDAKEHRRRRDERVREILSRGISFILDASIDRSWKQYYEELKKNGYHWLVISLDLSRSLLEKLYQNKNYSLSPAEIDKNLKEHEKFLAEFGDQVALHITDDDFPDRLRLSYECAKLWIESWKKYSATK